ncbi:MAG: O-antigen ligase family protein [Flavobacteriales bacterium]
MRWTQIHNALFTLFFGVWLIFPQITGPYLGLLFLSTLIGCITKAAHFSWSWKFSPWVILFLMYGVSILFSAEPALELGSLERKLSLLAFPVLFSFTWKASIDLRNVWLIHVLACFVLVILAFADSFYCARTLGETVRCFSTSYFSQIHHPTYFSAFLIFAIVGLLYNRVAWFDSKPRGFRMLLMALFALVHINLGALGGILALLLVFAVYFFLRFKNRLGYVKSTLLVALLFLLLFLTAYGSAEIRADINNAFSYTRQYFENPSAFVQGRKEPLEGNEVRLILWTASLKILQEHPLGVGIGGMEQEMSRQLKEWGYPKQASKQFNPHNQFLQITNEIGLLGLLLLLLIFFGGYRWTASYYQKEVLLFTLSFFVLCLFESMLQRQSGIVFFLSWLGLFMFNSKSLVTWNGR